MNLDTGLTHLVKPSAACAMVAIMNHEIPQLLECSLGKGSGSFGHKEVLSWTIPMAQPKRETMDKLNYIEILKCLS